MGALPDLNARLSRYQRLLRMNVAKEPLHCIFSLSLSAVRMDRSTWQAFVEEKIVKKVGCFFIVDKDNRARRRHGQHEIVDTIALF